MNKLTVLVIVSLLTVTALFSQYQTRSYDKVFIQNEINRYKNIFNTQQSGLGFANYIDVHYYGIDITVTTSPQFISGSVLMRAECLQNNISTLTLDLMNSLTVDSVKAYGITLSFSQYYSYFDITLDHPYNTGETMEILVYYKGVPGSSGFGSFEFSSHSSVPWVWSLSEPYGAKDWWPCKDHPADKADSVDISVTCDSSYKTGSNGKLISVVGNGDGTVTYNWKELYPISTYLVSIALTNYAQFSNWFKYSPTDSMEVLNYVLPEHLASAQSGLPYAVDGLEIFSDLFGLYPFINEKYGHAEFGWGGGMEHQTMTYLGGFSEWLVTHELSHQWFGDMITCKTWPDLWLNEGFATYCEALYAERKYGKSSYWGVVNGDMANARNAYGTLYLQDTSSVGYMFDGSRVYSKGATVLHILRHVVGDTMFFRSMYNYANDSRFKYGTATTYDLQEVFETTSGIDLDYFFNDWVFGEKYPKYQFGWSSATAPSGYAVTVQIAQTTGTTNPLFFRMPVDLKVSSSGWDTTVVVFNDSLNQTFTFTVSHDPSSVQLDPEGWILKDIVASSISLLPVSRYYGNVEIGKTKSDSITFTNNGALPVTVSSVLSNLTDVSVTPSSASIASGTNRKFYVTFAPTAYGTQTGAIIFIHSGLGSPDSVIISGKGVYPTSYYPHSRSWNIVSLPVTVFDPRRTVLFPDALTDAYRFDPDSGYVSSDSLAYGQGYWLKFPGENNAGIAGGERLSDTIDLIPGWNLIGSLSVPVPTGAITTEPPEIIGAEYFGFDGAYFIADSIMPGKGYWVKADEPGQLFLDTNMAFLRQTGLISRYHKYNQISFTDRSGNGQELYFSANCDNTVLNRSQMPPLPPDGSFDVRFSSGRMFELFSGSANLSRFISVSTDSYPLEVSWMIHEAGNNYQLSVGKKRIELGGEGMLILNKPGEGIELMLEGGRNIPGEYSLEQNHPNPFNPWTLIRYSIPADGRVSLKVYNILGSEVASLVDEYQEAGIRSVIFNAERLSSGLYFYKFQSGTFTDVRKMVVVK